MAPHIARGTRVYHDGHRSYMAMPWQTRALEHVRTIHGQFRGGWPQAPARRQQRGGFHNAFAIEGLWGQMKHCIRHAYNMIPGQDVEAFVYEAAWWVRVHRQIRQVANREERTEMFAQAIAEAFAPHD